MTIEELQIIISAKTESVHAKIDKLKEKIASVQPKKAADVNVTTDKAQGNLKKLQAEIDRTQAKIQKLADKQNAVQSEIDARTGMYSAVPNLSGMGHEETVGTLMDRDPKVQELTEQMSALDAQTAPLKAHLAETKAQIAAAGNAAEPAAEKTRKFGESMRTAGGHIQNAARSGGAFSRMTSRMLLSMALYQGVAFVFKSISEGIQDMALGNAQANSTMSQLATSALYLKNSIAAALMPTLQALTPVINQVADALANVFNTIAMLSARIFNHASTVAIAQRANVNYAATLDKTGDKASRASKKIKELQRTVMGFDELNVLNQKTPDMDTPRTSAGAKNNGMPAAGAMFKNVKIPQWVNNIGAITDQVGKVISTWWNGLTNAQKWGAGIGGTAGFIIGGIIGHLIGGPIGTIVGAALGAAAGVAIGVWWNSLTTREKWSAGIGAGAGAIIGGIIGGLLGGKIGALVGAVLGGVAGALIGKWWADLTMPQKWGAGIGAGAGAIIGGIIGGLIGGPIGVAVGVILGGTAGAIIGKWWADLTTPQKWSVGIGAGAGAIIGGILGTLICPGLGTVLGAALGGVAGGLIGKWWSGLTTKQKWSGGIGAGAGAVIGGIIGTLICPGIGTILGALLGGTAGTLIAKWWSTLKSNQKWSVGTTGIGAVIGGIIGGIFLGPLGIVLGAGIGGLVANLIKKFWDFMKNPSNWKVGAAGIGAVIGGIIGTIIGGPLGTIVGSALGGAVGYGIGKLVSHAKGTSYHKGGPALVNDAPGSVYRELIQYPNGQFFIPNGRNVLIPDLPIGSKVLPAKQTEMLFPHYAGGIGQFDSDRISILPTIQKFGMSDLFADKNIPSLNSEPSQSTNQSNDTDRIISRMDKMERAIENLKVCLYTSDRMIAESSNRGNRQIDRLYHPIATT